MAEIPSDFSDALRNAGLIDFFAGCTESHQREYLNWINEAKRPDTRIRRIRQAAKMLGDKCRQETAKKKRG